MEKRAYYKPEDKEGSIFVKGVSREQFALLCELLGTTINDINGLNPLPTLETEEAQAAQASAPMPELPAEYEEEPQGFDPEELEKNFSAMFDATTETETEVAEEVAEETAVESTEAAETTEAVVETPVAAVEETAEEENCKYVFSILKVGETSISSPAKAVKEMKAFAQGKGILLYNEGPKMYVVTKSDKECLETAYTFLRKE